MASMILQMVVSYAIQAIFAPKPKDTFGPRLGDTRVQVSTYGKVIPQIYGSMRTAGNVIWSTPLIETSHSQSQGGKGGGSATYTSYTYAASFAVSLCSTAGLLGGVIAGIGKIWADGNLIYNGSSTDIGTIVASAAAFSAIRVYNGSETQNPDPLMQAYLGAANVPAYRGQALIVFDTLQLETYGNRIPNIECEVFTVASSAVGTTTTVRETHSKGNAYTVAGCYTRTDKLTMWAADWDSWGTSYVVWLVDILATGSAVTRGSFTSPWSGGGLANVCVTDTPICALGQPGVYTGELRVWDDTFSPRSFYYPYGFFDVGNTARVAKYKDVFCWGSTTLGAAGVAVYSWSTQLYLGSIAYPSGYVCESIEIDDSFVYVLWRNAALDTRVTQYNRITMAFVAELITTPFSNQSRYITRDKTTGDIYILCDDVKIYKIIAGVVVLYLATGGPTPDSNSASFGKIGDTFIGFNVYTTPVGGGLNGNFTLIYKYTTPAPVTLSGIVSSLCNQVGANNVDVSQLTDMVDGYMVTTQMTARAAIEPLQRVFYFDAVESDSLIKFIKRGIHSAAVIPEDDLAAHDHATPTVPVTVDLTRAQELELPRVVNATYYNSGNNYLQGAQRATRQVTNSQQTQDLQLAICMSDSKAKQVADVNLYLAWVERNVTKFSTSRKYGYLDPADTVQISRSSGVTYNLLITKRTERPGGIIDWEAVADDPTVYTQTAAASSGAVAVVNTVPFIGPTHCELLDIPLLRDADNDAGFYTAANGYTTAWNGGALAKSSDGATYAIAETFNVPGSILGMTSTALGNFTGGNVFDETSSVTVVLQSGTLASVARLDVLNGMNGAVIGNEVIQFRIATLIAANTYVLSGLLRGRFGTEWRISTHAVSERFVLLSAATLQRVSASSSEIGLARSYKAVSNGQLLSDADVINFTNNANGLKPLSPVLIGGGRDSAGNLTIQWTRRTRLSGGWLNYSDVPIGEVAESYSIDIMSGSTVKRTLTSTVPTVSYTSAQQVTDFGSNQSSVSVNIYQISAVAGRGFPGSATV